MKFKTAGDKHFTDNLGIAETTVDVVLRARAKMAGERINGPADSTVKSCFTKLRGASKPASWDRKVLPTLEIGILGEATRGA